MFLVVHHMFMHNISFNLKRSEERRVGKEIIPSCKIHMVDKETLDGGPKGGGKEELGEGEWVLLNTLSLRKTKI